MKLCFEKKFVQYKFTFGIEVVEQYSTINLGFCVRVECMNGWCVKHGGGMWRRLMPPPRFLNFL